MIHVTPPWLEVGCVIGLTLVVYLLGLRHYRALTLELNALGGEERLIQEWFCHNWRRAVGYTFFSGCIQAPLIEEILYRSCSIFMIQSGQLYLGLMLGTVYNVLFALHHGGMSDGFYADKRRHQIAAFVAGTIILALGCVSGLLIVAVLAHILMNLKGMGYKELRFLKANQMPSRFYFRFGLGKGHQVELSQT